MAPTNTKTDRYENNVLLATEIFTQYESFIRAVICSRVRDKDQANDLFQNFFLSLVFRPIPGGVDNVKSYLYRAIINDIVDTVHQVERYKSHICRYSKQLKYPISNSRPENAFIEKEQLDELLTLIKRRLTVSESQAVSLRYDKNHSVKEVADKMGVNSRSVSRYISVGLKKNPSVFGGKVR